MAPWSWIAVTALALISVLPALAEAQTPETALREGGDAMRRGAFEAAVGSFTEAVAAFRASGRRTAAVGGLVQLSQAHVSLGRYRAAIESLEEALDLARASGDDRQIAHVQAALGNAYIATGPHETAERYLGEALTTARRLADGQLTALVLNNLGNALSARHKGPDAIAAYVESASLARTAGLPVLAARALVNGAVAHRQGGTPSVSRTLLDEATEALKGASPSHETAFTRVSIGLGYRDLRPWLADARPSLTLAAWTAFTAAADEAARIGDGRAASYALGYLGELYEVDRRHDEGLDLTRRAVFAAQQVNAPESLYRWQWQAGRLLSKTGQTEPAIDSYRRAVQTLQAIRPELSRGYGAPTGSFRDNLGRIYFELVDLLLQQAAGTTDGQRRSASLLEARNTVELFKVAELRDYFRDDCVDTALSKAAQLDVVSQTAVVVYPVVLRDRTELLVSLPSGLKSIVVPVGEEALTREVRLFRRLLEKRTTRQFLPHAQRLYDWLVRPLEPELAGLGIETLVFVPDGSLRTIPMAALHDGARFLISKYAVAVTPGLSLSDPRPLRRQDARVLAVGVTEAVQGYPPLPNVAGELQALRALFNATTLVDGEFQVGTLERALREEPFTIVHVASHGEFGSDPASTFLLAFDGRVTMDRLEQYVGLFRFRDDPLELLTLSACETAEGDDRAALGLAGIAVKAGARSAVATLWQINDEASAQLVEAFYRNLLDPSLSRAVALQRAQLTLVEDPRYGHPGFWAPFLLINNWL